MTSTLQPYRVAVVGDEEIATRLDHECEEGGQSLTLSTIEPADVSARLDEIDCLLVDQRLTDESWQSVVERARAGRPSVPVVVLVADDLENGVSAAIEAGATDYLPRSLTETDPAIVTGRVADIVGRSDASSGGTDDGEQVLSSDERFRLVTENVDEIIYIADGDFSDIEYVNSAYEAVWGRPVEELYSDATAFIDGIDPRDRESFERDFEAMRADIRDGTPDESYEFEFRVQQPDGEIRWVLATGYPVQTETGTDRYVGIVEDITERRELERTHRELFENVSDGLVVHEPDSGEIVDANQQFCEMTGYEHEELVGEPVDIVTSLDDDFAYERARERIRQARDDGPQLFEWRGQRKNGDTYPVEVHLTLAAFRGEERVIASVRDISERKETEARFQTIVERIDAGVMLVPEGESEPEYLNPVYEELTGIPVADLYDPEAFVEHIHPADREGYTNDVAAMVEDILAGDADDSYEFEFRFERPDGETRWFHWTGYPLLEEDNDYWYVGMTTDVTERRERQQRLETERDRRSVLFENTPDPIMAVEFRDGQPYITEVNQSFGDAFGVDAESATDRPIADVIVPETERDGYDEIREQALAGNPVEREVQRETADGVRDFLLRVLPFESGGDRHAYVWYTDITERKRRERAIEEERQKYSTLVEQSTDGVVVVRDEKYVFVNEQFAEITGYDRDELLGMSFEKVFTPGSRELVRKRYRKRVAGESPPSQYDVEVETADGDRVTLELSVSRIRHEGEPATLANFRDVTERRERERTVEQLQRATERFQSAETTEDVYRIAVETARDVLGLPMTASWRHEDDAERLTDVAGTGPVEAMEQGPVSFTPDDYEYDVFTAGEAVTYDPSEYHAHNPLDGCILVPVGEHGLLAAGQRGREEYEPYLVDAAQVLAGHAATALDRVERAEQLRRSEYRLQAIIDRIDEAIFLAPVSELNEGEPAPDFVSSGYEDIWGQPLDGLHETHEEGFFSTLHPDDYDGYVAFVERIVADIEAGSPEDRYQHEYRIERPDGEIRWVHSDVYPTEWTDGSPRVVIASRDITDRKERERTLESFHDATAELTTADTVTEAGQIAVGAAADVFDLPATAVYHYDEETATLEPTASGPEVPDVTDLTPLTADHDGAWEAFVGETMHRVDSSDEPALDVGPADEVLLFPLGGNGVLAVWRSSETFDTDAASILAATLEAALNRLRGERQLESRREELEAQTERARRLESIAELTQRVEAAITTKSSRQGIQDAVCAELVDVDPFDAAWIAAAAVGTEQLTPRAVAGLDRDHVEQVLASDTPGQSDPHPVTEAWQTGEPFVVNDLVGGGRRSDWGQLLLKAGAGAVCAVPLAYSGITYGVLTIIASEPDAFGDREVDVLSQLGTSIGYAITAIERQRALESDDTLELEFQGTDMDVPFARLARELDCRVRHERTIRRQDGSVSVYYTLLDGVPDAVGETATDILPGEVDVVSQQDDEAVLERQGSSWFGALISEYGGVLRRGRATTGGVELVVELPQEADTRTIVERLREEFPALELTAQRQHRETDATPSEVRNRLHQRLSDRQYEALETAHAMGYFDWPRESSGEEVADTLGITQPTVNKHIRLGEQKVFELLFGSATSSSPTSEP
jgi:PAS domain S-box-containing protein